MQETANRRKKLQKSSFKELFEIVRDSQGMFDPPNHDLYKLFYNCMKEDTPTLMERLKLSDSQYHAFLKAIISLYLEKQLDRETIKIEEQFIELFNKSLVNADR